MNKKSLLQNAPLKVVSLIIGYGFWHMFGATHTITQWIQVPLTFYNTDETTTIQAPESVDVQLAATRERLSYINKMELAAHIDASTLHNGPNALELTNEQLLLPTTIRVNNCNPSTITATLTHNTKNITHKIPNTDKTIHEMT